MLWLKRPIVKLFPNLEPIYDQWIAPILENFLVLTVGTVLIGISVYWATGGDLTMAIRLANLFSWSLFFAGHLADLKIYGAERAPPVNLAFAGFIASVNIALGFLPLSPFYLILTIVFGSTIIHFITNATGQFIPALISNVRVKIGSHFFNLAAIWDKFYSLFFSKHLPFMEAGLMGKYQLLSLPSYTETGQNQGKVSAKVKNLETGEEKEIEIKAQMWQSYGVKGSLNSLKKKTEDSLAKEIIDYALLKLPQTFLVLEENSDSIFGISKVKVDGGETIAIADFLLDDPIGLFHEAAESYFAKNGMENIYKKLMPWEISMFLDDWKEKGNIPGIVALDGFIHELESHLRKNPFHAQKYLTKGKDEELALQPQDEELTLASQYKEIISYYFYYRDWDTSEKELFPHTFLRGSGRTLREIYAQWEALGRALTDDSLVEFIEYAKEEYSYEIPLRERHLLLLNLKTGLKGKELLFGLQDRAFGEEQNQELSSKLSEKAKENKPDSETGILEIVNYLGEAGGKEGAQGGAQKGDKYIYDPVIKREVIRKLKSEKSLISREDDEFRALYEETEKIFKDVLGAARDYLISAGERDRAEGLLDADIFLADLNSANAGAYLYLNFVVINMGLFKELLKEGTLTKDLIAFILAHEVVHLIQFREDFDAGRIQLNAGFKSIDDLIAGKLEQHIDKYGREQDADVRAVELVNNAGYSVSEITLFFEKMAKEKKFRNKFQTMIDKHAPPETRIEYLKKIRKRSNWRKVKAEETEKFSQKTIDELNGERSKNRVSQERLLAIKSLEEVEETAKNAKNMEELEFLISWGILLLKVILITLRRVWESGF